MKTSPSSVLNLPVKKALRRVMIHQRNQLTSSQRQRASQVICRQVSQLPRMASARRIALFLPWNSEVDLTPLMSALWRKGKQVLIPDTRQGLPRTGFVPFSPQDILSRGLHGPRELVEHRPYVAFGKIEVLLVPGLAFDREGFRLGYGGGVYDRVLKRASKAFSVGVGFAAQLIDRLPKDRWDLPVDRVVTESQTC